MRNIFIQKSHTKCGGEKLSYRPLAFTSYEAFSKNKKRSGTSLSTSFSA